MLHPRQKRRLARLEQAYQITASDSDDTVGRIIDLLLAIVGETMPATGDTEPETLDGDD